MNRMRGRSKRTKYTRSKMKIKMLLKDLNGYFESEVVFEELKRVQPGSVQFSSVQRFSAKWSARESRLFPI